MKILFLTLRADFGGGPEHLWQLLRHLPDDIKAYVACPKDYPYYNRFCECIGEDNLFSLPHRRFSLGKLLHLRAFCKEHRIDVLHSHGKGAGAYSRPLSAITGLPCIHTFHGLHMAEYGTGKKNLYRLYEQCLGRFTRVGISVSKSEQEQLLREKLIPQDRLYLIPNGVEIPAQPVHPPKGAPYPVISISRFDYSKNSMFLVHILQSLRERGRLDDFRFIVVGDGPERKMVQEYAMEQNLSNFLHCLGASATPHRYFFGALCCLSTSRREGMPLALLEAMAHGLPVVASNVTGNCDVVLQGITGLLYPEGNPVAAADALIRLVDEPGLHIGMGAAARTCVSQEHDVRLMAARTMKLFGNL